MIYDIPKSGMREIAIQAQFKHICGSLPCWNSAFR